MATPKNTTFMFHGKNDPPFSKPLIGQGCTEKYYICDIIPYNPDQ